MTSDNKEMASPPPLNHQCYLQQNRPKPTRPLISAPSRDEDGATTMLMFKISWLREHDADESVETNSPLFVTSWIEVPTLARVLLLMMPAITANKTRFLLVRKTCPQFLCRLSLHDPEKLSNIKDAMEGVFVHGCKFKLSVSKQFQGRDPQKQWYVISNKCIINWIQMN